MSEIATRTPQQELVARVRSEEVQEQIAFALPEDVSPRRYMRLLVTALLKNPEFAAIGDPNSLLGALVQAAADGLIPDGRQAALVKRGGKVCYEPMVHGLRQRAAEYGWQLRSSVVYENDEFSHTKEPPTLRHVETRPGQERGKLVAAYAIAEHVHLGRRQLVFYEEDVAKRRAKAQTQAIWNEWPAEMWEAKVAKALCNDLENVERFRLVTPDRTEQADSLAAMYGPHAREVSQDPSASPAEFAASSSRPSRDGGEGQQAGDALSPSPASPAPDPDDDPEPGGEPDFARGNAEAAGRQPLPATQPPIRGLTIAQAHAEHPEEFRQWCEWALKQTAYAVDAPDLGKRHFGNALRAFLTVNAPDVLGERRAA